MNSLKVQGMSNSKIVNLVWLGDKPIYDKYQESIKQYLPDWEIKIWTDKDFEDVKCPYFRFKMKYRQWAVASDYVRFKILYENGGLYVDTDVQFLQGIDDLVDKGNFLGTEFISKRISSGVIMYFEKPHHPLLKDIICIYENPHHPFYICDGEVMKYCLMKHGYKPIDKTQKINDITIYDSSYFCPNTIEDCYINIKENTRAIHHYTGFWRE